MLPGNLRDAATACARITALMSCLLILPAGTAQSQPAAAQIYQDYCSVCHGDAGNGQSRAAGSFDPPVRDFTTAAASAELTRERMIASIAGGRPGTAMSAWGNQLTGEQIEAVVDYIREKFMLPATSAEDNEGRRLYAEYCSVCHGDRGDGRSRASESFSPPPRDFTSASSARELTRERMLFSVKYGRPNTAMTGWGEQLSDAQVEAVVDYLQQAFMPAQATASHGEATAGTAHAQHDGEMDMSAPFPEGLVGDASWGEAFYRANCVACHGEQGDGRGPRAYFINPKPRDFSHPAARASLNRPHLYEAIAIGKLGTEMPAWKYVIGPDQIAHVAEYVLQAFILAGDTTGKVKTEPTAHGATNHAPGQAH